MVAIGKQTDGASDRSIKKMAITALTYTGKSFFDIIADIGAGKGELSELLTDNTDKIIMVDDFVATNLPTKAEHMKFDLNHTWELESESVDFLFSLEVIEHIENPRHFFREAKRVLKKGGYGFISTPNSLNIFSRINFLFKGCHRFFQDSCYPAHITPLTKTDFERIIKENQLMLLSFFYNYEDTIPLIRIPINIKHPNLSNSIGVLFEK